MDLFAKPRRSATPTEPRFQCRHIFTDGRRCGSPSLRNDPFCYFHHNSRKPIANPEKRKSRRTTFALPLPEDQSSIQQGIGVVLQRIAENGIDIKRAGLLLYGYQTASINLPRPPKLSIEMAPTLVEEFIHDEALGPVAPTIEFRPQMSQETSLIQMHKRMQKAAEEEAIRLREEKFDMAQALSRAESRIKDLEHKLRQNEELSEPVIETIQAVAGPKLKPINRRFCARTVSPPHRQTSQPQALSCTDETTSPRSRSGRTDSLRPLPHPAGCDRDPNELLRRVLRLQRMPRRSSRTRDHRLAAGRVEPASRDVRSLRHGAQHPSVPELSQHLPPLRRSLQPRLPQPLPPLLRNELSELHEAHRRRVHAVAQSGRSRPVIEHVPQVRVAVPAGDGGALHAECLVRDLGDVLWRDGLVEAGPSRAGLELGLGTEDRRVATDAAVEPVVMVIPGVTGVGALCAGLARNFELDWRQLLLPLRVCLDGAWDGHFADAFPRCGELNDSDSARSCFDRCEQASA